VNEIRFARYTAKQWLNAIPSLPYSSFAIVSDSHGRPFLPHSLTPALEIAVVFTAKPKNAARRASFGDKRAADYE
jgi:hypothetical protein